MREFGELVPEMQVLAYHERSVPPDLPKLAPNIQPRHVEMRGSRFHLWEKLRMPLEIRRDRIDVYHGTYNTLPPRWFRWRSPAMVVSLHDVVVTWWEGDGIDSYGEHVRRVTARVCREADRILTVSEFSRRDICERFSVPEEKVEIFYNGIPPAFLVDPPAGSAEQARARYARGSPYLFSIGSSLRRKNTRGFLDALAILARNERFEHRAVITGLGVGDLEELRGYAQSLGISGRVGFYGYLSHDELAKVFAGADLTVYPSFAEGWGIPILESFAMGTPVATSRTTSMPEAGGDSASYFDPGNSEEMAEVILDALDNQSRWERVREAARERARRFTWRTAAEKTLAVYQQVC
jgi:glycosyltransferase involved in cell wall biosynthesis